MHKAGEHHTNNILLAPGTFFAFFIQNDIVATNCVVIHVARTQQSEPEVLASPSGEIAYYPLKSP
jgi:hypothetical protein